MPLRPVKGHYITLRGENILQRTIRNPDVYLIPRKNEIYVGATMEEDGLNPKRLTGSCLDLLFYAYQVVPEVYEQELTEFGFGFRPALRDHQPAIGQTDISRLFVNIGHFRHGILIAPAVARLLLQLFKEKQLSPFCPQRFVSCNEKQSSSLLQ